MTTELEEQFFKVFGIEPKNKCGKNLIYPNCLNPDKCGYDNCIYYQIEYPEITDRRLLEIITSLANALCNYFVPCVDYYNLKSRLLYDCIQNKENEELQYNIQQLFKERK